MIDVTDKALAALESSLTANQANEGEALRLARNPQGEFGLALDQEREGDAVVKLEERPILIVGKDISDALDGAILDVDESPQGARLTLRMPEQGGPGQAN